MDKLKYGNWIRTKVLWLLGAITIVLMTLAAVPVPSIIRVISGVVGLGCLVSFLLPFYSYIMFSPRCGNLQEKAYDLIIEHLDSSGSTNILDIGTGNGILAIKIAQANLAAKVTGVDYWGKDWSYSKSVCEENARIANVAERVVFSKGNAAALNFPDGTFDRVVSNLTFHEVKMVKQKINVLREALRVVKPGGRFVFIDHFHAEKYYGKNSEFENSLRNLKLQQLEIKHLYEVLDLPKILRHPRILGKVGIIWGKK
jgi:SAM-dependent methyltransferase